jgi:hypothetical protein
MEGIRKTEKKPEDVDLIVQDILEKEKHLDDENQKINLLIISFYKKLGNDKLKDLLHDDPYVFRYARRKLAKMGIPETDENYDEKLKIEKQNVLDSFNSNNIVPFIKEVYPTDSEADNEESVPANDIVGILKYNFDSRKDGGKNVEIHLRRKDFSDGADGFQFQKSLSLLCDELVKMKRIPKGLIAKSWLMGVDAVRNRAGFEKISETTFNPDIYENMSLWGQFLDSKGNLKEKEITYLFEHNIPRYNATEAGINIAGFFKKYGNQYIGKELETVNMEKLDDEEKRIDQLSKEINNYANEILTDDRYRELMNLIAQHPVSQRILNNGPHINILDYIKQAKQEGVTIMESFSKIDPEDRHILNEQSRKIKEEYIDDFAKSHMEKIVIK